MTDDIRLNEQLKNSASALKLHGLVSRWDEIDKQMIPYIKTWVDWEEQERNARGLDRRLRHARIGRFKSLAEFDWGWVNKLDQCAIEQLMTLTFIGEASNAVFVGPNGVGKTTIAQNIAHHAVIQGYSVLFTTAARMLNELAAQDGDSALRRRIKHYSQPQLLVIDEVGYLSYGNRHADLLFEIINRRYEEKSTLVTTNRPFNEWGEVFPSASCVVSLIDRLIHHAEIIPFDAESYRVKEAKERTQQRSKRQAKPRGKKAVKPQDNADECDA